MDGMNECDECDEGQRDDVILRLWEIQTVYAHLVCQVLKQDAGNALTLRPEHFTETSTVSIPEKNPDIADFIQIELERRVEFGRLKKGEPTLVLEIRGCRNKKSSRHVPLGIAPD